MTLGQLNGFLAATVRAEKAALARDALAMRAAQSDDKTWKKLMKEWQDGE